MRGGERPQEFLWGLVRSRVAGKIGSGKKKAASARNLCGAADKATGRTRLGALNRHQTIRQQTYSTAEFSLKTKTPGSSHAVRSRGFYDQTTNAYRASQLLKAKCARRFCCQQDSSSAVVQNGFSFPKLMILMRSALTPRFISMSFTAVARFSPRPRL